MDYRGLAQGLAVTYGLPWNLVNNLVQTESGWKPTAYNKKSGAIGLTQLMPGTARDMGVDPHVPEQNLEGGLKYLRMLIDRYGGDVQKALAAYNWGMGNVERKGLAAMPAETRSYIRNVSGGAPETVAPAPAPTPKPAPQEAAPMQQTIHPSLSNLQELTRPSISDALRRASDLFRPTPKYTGQVGMDQLTSQLQLMQASAELYDLERKRQEYQTKIGAREALAQKYPKYAELIRAGAMTPEGLTQMAGLGGDWEVKTMEAPGGGKKSVLYNKATQETRDMPWPGGKEPGPSVPLSEIRSWRGEAAKELGPKRAAAESARQLQVFLEKPGPLGDIGVIYNLVKTLDPTSVVREGEVGLFNSARSLYDRLDTMIRQAQEGGALGPSTRKNVVETMGELMKLFREQSGITVGKWKTFSDRWGINPLDIDATDIEFPEFKVQPEDDKSIDDRMRGLFGGP